MYARPLSTPYRVIIVDDHKFVAEILAQRLSMIPASNSLVLRITARPRCTWSNTNK